ncbi:MAG: hypothetical protein HQ553_17120 [Chloroflexi bacterium]|nr:hypothetical protein [Chloroflexota bacterium]
MNDVSEVRKLGELRLTIPNGLHKKLKLIALEKESSLKQLIIDVLEGYTQNTQKQQKEETLSK